MTNSQKINLQKLSLLNDQYTEICEVPIGFNWNIQVWSISERCGFRLLTQLADGQEGMQPAHVPSATWLLFIVVVNCLRLGLSMQPSPAWNSLCGQDWPQTSGILLPCARSSLGDWRQEPLCLTTFYPCVLQSPGAEGKSRALQTGLCCCVPSPRDPAPSVRFPCLVTSAGSLEPTFHTSAEVHVHHVHTLNWCVTN